MTKFDYWADLSLNLLLLKSSMKMPSQDLNLGQLFAFLSFLPTEQKAVQVCP